MVISSSRTNYVNPGLQIAPAPWSFPVPGLNNAISRMAISSKMTGGRESGVFFVRRYSRELKKFQHKQQNVGNDPSFYCTTTFHLNWLGLGSFGQNNG